MKFSTDFVFYVVREIFVSYGNITVEYRVDMDMDPRNVAHLMKTFLAPPYFADILGEEEIQRKVKFTFLKITWQILMKCKRSTVLDMEEASRLIIVVGAAN